MALRVAFGELSMNLILIISNKKKYYHKQLKILDKNNLNVKSPIARRLKKVKLTRFYVFIVHI